MALDTCITCTREFKKKDGERQQEKWEVKMTEIKKRKRKGREIQYT